MANSSAQTNHGQRTVLADAIRRRQGDIEQRWLAREQVDVEAAGHRVSPTDLRNAIGDYLVKLADALRTERTIETGGAEAWKDLAREHALTRVRLGFDIDQLVHEFIVLRRVMFEVAREEGLVPDEGHGERLADLMEAAIAASVKSYVDSRDYAARRERAEHIGFVTHELRNPLTAATVAASQVRRQGGKDPEVARALDLMERSLARIRDLIDKVLLTEQLELGEIDSRPEDVALGRLMDDAARNARQDAEMKGVGFDMRCDPDILLHVDPSLAVSALQNVMDNAVKFTDEGQVDVSVDDQPSHVVVHVHDGCTGISPQELATIFEPFHRGHRRKPGTGLGLAIARRAIESQGGKIHAESSQEVGCHFWLTLPKVRH